MVAGFQDELDSEDEAVTAPSVGQKSSRPVIAQDIDLSSEDEDITHSNPQVAKYNEDYVSSEEEQTVKVTKVNSANVDVSDSDLVDARRKSKSNSVVSSASYGDRNEGASAIGGKSDISKVLSNANNTEVVTNKDSDVTKTFNTSVNNEQVKSRKTSSDSSVSDHMTDSTNKNKPEVTNENSDSESDGGCPVTVLQDADINPDDFGGEDVFNDWLNKQEKVG